MPQKDPAPNSAAPQNAAPAAGKSPGTLRRVAQPGRTDPAGRVVESADVLLNGQESNLEQLALLANAIVDLGEIYRATPGRRNGL